MPLRHVRALRLWLGTIALLIVAMILVGGATRLTDSGLSITEWKPIHGVIPRRLLAAALLTLGVTAGSCSFALL